MRKWFKARIESLLDNLIFTAFLAGGAAVWTAGKSLPTPVIIGVSIAVFVVVLIVFRLFSLNIKRHAIQIKEQYEDNAGECGLIFRNNSSTNLTNCQARLIDLAFEIPHPRYSLERYPKSEDLICTQNVAGFSDGKIPLFRWGWSGGSKDLEIVYQSGTHKIGYGIVSVPILALLNVWADNIQNTYAVCKLSDRMGWGYELSILKTGLQKGKPTLVDFQRSGSHTSPA
jgi:hypothetical protein